MITLKKSALAHYVNKRWKDRSEKKKEAENKKKVPHRKKGDKKKIWKEHAQQDNP